MELNRILVVDRDEAALDLLESALRRVGLEPTSALSHSTALTVFGRIPSAAVIIAVGTDAAALAALIDALRQRGGELPIFLLGEASERAAVRSASDAIALGADYWFRAPLEAEYIAGRVRQWLEQPPTLKSQDIPEPSLDLVNLNAELEGNLDLEAFSVRPGALGPTHPSLRHLKPAAPTAQLAPPPFEEPPPESQSQDIEVGFLEPEEAQEDSSDLLDGRELVKKAEELRQAGRLQEALPLYLAAATIYEQEQQLQSALTLCKLVLRSEPTRAGVALRVLRLARLLEREEDGRAAVSAAAEQLREAGRERDARQLEATLGPSEPPEAGTSSQELAALLPPKEGASQAPLPVLNDRDGPEDEPTEELFIDDLMGGSKDLDPAQIAALAERAAGHLASGPSRWSTSSLPSLKETGAEAPPGKEEPRYPLKGALPSDKPKRAPEGSLDLAADGSRFGAGGYSSIDRSGAGPLSGSGTQDSLPSWGATQPAGGLPSHLQGEPQFSLEPGWPEDDPGLLRPRSEEARAAPEAERAPAEAPLAGWLSDPEEAPLQYGPTGHPKRSPKPAVEEAEDAPQLTGDPAGRLRDRLDAEAQAALRKASEAIEEQARRAEQGHQPQTATEPISLLDDSAPVLSVDWPAADAEDARPILKRASPAAPQAEPEQAADEAKAEPAEERSEAGGEDDRAEVQDAVARPEAEAEEAKPEPAAETARLETDAGDPEPVAEAARPEAETPEQPETPEEVEASPDQEPAPEPEATEERAAPPTRPPFFDPSQRKTAAERRASEVSGRERRLADLRGGAHAAESATSDAARRGDAAQGERQTRAEADAQRSLGAEREALRRSSEGEPSFERPERDPRRPEGDRRGDPSGRSSERGHPEASPRPEAHSGDPAERDFDRAGPRGDPDHGEGLELGDSDASFDLPARSARARSQDPRDRNPPFDRVDRPGDYEDRNSFDLDPRRDPGRREPSFDPPVRGEARERGQASGDRNPAFDRGGDPRGRAPAFDRPAGAQGHAPTSEGRNPAFDRPERHRDRAEERYPDPAPRMRTRRELDDRDPAFDRPDRRRGSFDDRNPAFESPRRQDWEDREPSRAREDTSIQRPPDHRSRGYLDDRFSDAPPPQQDKRAGPPGRPPADSRDLWPEDPAPRGGAPEEPFLRYPTPELAEDPEERAGPPWPAPPRRESSDGPISLFDPPSSRPPAPRAGWQPEPDEAWAPEPSVGWEASPTGWGQPSAGGWLEGDAWDAGWSASQRRLPARRLDPPEGRIQSPLDAVRLLGALRAQGATGQLRTAGPSSPLLIAGGDLVDTASPSATVQDLFQRLDLPTAGLGEGQLSALVEQSYLHPEELLSCASQLWDRLAMELLGSRGGWRFEPSEVSAALPSTQENLRYLVDLVAQVQSPMQLIAPLGGPAVRLQLIKSAHNLLPGREARLLNQLNGRPSLEEAARIAGLPPYRAAAAAVVLVGLGYAQPLSRPPPGAPPYSSPSRRPRQAHAPSAPPRPAPVTTVNRPLGPRTTNQRPLTPPPYPPGPDRTPAPYPHRPPEQAGGHGALGALSPEQRLQALFELVRSSDYFTILGVGGDATKRQIDDAHQQLRRLLDPAALDPAQAAQAREVLRSVDEARDVLRVPALREAYLKNLNRRS